MLELPGKFLATKYETKNTTPKENMKKCLISAIAFVLAGCAPHREIIISEIIDSPQAHKGKVIHFQTKSLKSPLYKYTDLQDQKKVFKVLEQRIPNLQKNINVKFIEGFVSSEIPASMIDSGCDPMNSKEIIVNNEKYLIDTSRVNSHTYLLIVSPISIAEGAHLKESDTIYTYGKSDPFSPNGFIRKSTNMISISVSSSADVNYYIVNPNDGKIIYSANIQDSKNTMDNDVWCNISKKIGRSIGNDVQSIQKNIDK